MQRFTQDAQAEVQELQQELQAEFQQRLEPVLSQVASEMGLQFVFNGPDAGLVWADSALDISAEVIKKLDSAKPPAKPAAHEAAGSVNAGVPRRPRSPRPPLSLAPRRRRRRARAGEAAGGGQERHRQRGFFPGAFSAQAADAGGADDRGADAGGDAADPRLDRWRLTRSGRVQLRGVEQRQVSQARHPRRSTEARSSRSARFAARSSR